MFYIYLKIVIKLWMLSLCVVLTQVSEADPVSITFEEFEQNTLLIAELERVGIHFPNGVAVRLDHKDFTRNNQIIQPLLVDEFTADRLVITFTAPVASVALDVKNTQEPTQLESHKDLPIYITMKAQYLGNLGNASISLPDPVTSQIVLDREDFGWHRLIVEDPTNNNSITQVEVVVRESGDPRVNNHYLMADNLTVDLKGKPPLQVDSTAPIITLESAVSGTTTRSRFFDYKIDAQDNIRLDNVRIELKHVDTGEILSEAYVCGNLARGLCPSKDYVETFQAELKKELGDEYLLTATACDTANNCAEDTITLNYISPESITVDLWIIGMEYNQGWQDTVHVDYRNGGIGFVHEQDPTGRDTESAISMVPGKPMIIRVYVGRRNKQITSPEGVPITGRLIIDDGLVGGFTRTLKPFYSDNCNDFRGRPMHCDDNVKVFPPIGSLGLNTASDFDIDLISQRTHLGRTLNFYIPGDITARAAAGTFNLRAIVQPVSSLVDHIEWKESRETRLDNEFRLQIANIAEEAPLNLRLVRVRMPELNAPTESEANRVIEDLSKILLYQQPINVVSNSEYYYSGHVPFRYDIVDQCQTLWMLLEASFGFDDSATLLALTPSGVKLRGCTGYGWHPKFSLIGFPGSLIGTDDLLIDIRGIAFSRMPDYTSSITTHTDWNRLAIMAQEIFHADLDRRHVSNDHDEDGGCILSGFAADAAQFITGVDTDCFKPSVHPHGTIGDYPVMTIHSGRPGMTSLLLQVGRIYGNLGGMGIKIEPEPNRGLTLYDPCPLPFDMDNPMKSMDQRINLRRSISECQLDDNKRPHDFMSYGKNRWLAFQQVPLIKSFDALRYRTVANILAKNVNPEDKNEKGSKLRIRKIPGPAYYVSAAVSNSGELIFNPVFPADGYYEKLERKHLPDITLEVTDELGKINNYPILGAMVPNHHDNSQDNFVALSFNSAIPTVPKPVELSIVYKENTIGKLTGSKHVPEINIESPREGDKWNKQNIEEIVWSSHDRDKDILTYIVEYSENSGETWTSIGTVQDENTMQVRTEGLVSSDDALIRVSVTDGFHTNQQVTKSTFTVE